MPTEIRDGREYNEAPPRFNIDTNETVFNDYGEAVDFRIEGDSDTNAFIIDVTTDYAGIGVAVPATKLEIAESKTIAAATTDGYSAALTLDPAYTASSAQTVTRHNYIDVNNAATTSITLSNGCLFRFDAAAGTHCAVDAGTTKSTFSTVASWIKVNVNGTIHYVPGYASKTT